MVVGKCVFMLVYNSFWLFKAPCIPLSDNIAMILIFEVFHLVTWK